MTDNLAVTPGAGATIAAKDEGGGILKQRIQMESPAITSAIDITSGSTGSPYSAGDAWSDSTSAPTAGGFTFSGVARISGGATLLTDMMVTSSIASSALQVTILIFNQAVTAVNDNAVYAITDAEAKTMVAQIPANLANGYPSSNNSTVHIQNINCMCTCVGTADLRFLIRVNAAYTPASGEVLSVMGKFMTVN
jgi:hypothetical protein